MAVSVSVQITILWDMTLCTFVDKYQSFSKYLPEDEDIRFLLNAGTYLPTYTASYPRRHYCKYQHKLQQLRNTNDINNN